MAFESVVANYKLQPMWKRLLLVSVVSILPAALKVFEEGQLLQEELDQAVSNKDAAERKFKKARDRKANLPKLEEQLAYTEGQLALASKKLPDEFVIEKVLQKTSIIAQDVGINLQEFDPGEGVPTGGLFKYVEMPISLKLFGSYGQIATFFDRIVHLELLVHIKNIQMETDTMPEEQGSKPDLDTNANLSAEVLQKKAREKSRISASAEMVIFRTLTVQEESAIAAVEEKDKKKNKPKKPQPKT